jgi:glycosidase
LIAHSDYYSKNEDGQLHHPKGPNWADVAQLNHHHPEVMEYFVSTAQCWIELGVTGFRIDASYLIPNDYLNLWIQRVKELSFNTKVILDRWDILEQCSQADGVMTKDKPSGLTSMNDEQFWKVIYGHDEAAFGSLFSEQYPNGWSLHEAKERHKNIVLGSGQWSPNETVSFFESRHWDQQSFEDWLQQMRGQG